MRCAHQPFHSQEWSISISHSIKDLAFHTYSDEMWLDYQFSLPHLYILFERLGECILFTIHWILYASSTECVSAAECVISNFTGCVPFHYCPLPKILHGPRKSFWTLFPFRVKPNYPICTTFVKGVTGKWPSLLSATQLSSTHHLPRPHAGAEFGADFGFSLPAAASWERKKYRTLYYFVHTEAKKPCHKVRTLLIVLANERPRTTLFTREENRLSNHKLRTTIFTAANQTDVSICI